MLRSASPIRSGWLRLAGPACALAAAGAMAGCDGCSKGPVLTAAGGRMEIESVVDFGYVILGQQKEVKLPVRNSGRGTLKITSIDRVDGFPATVRYTPQRNIVLEPGNSATVTFVFEPEQEGLHEGTLQLKNDSAEQIVSLAVRGVGVRTHLKAVPETVEFGPVIVDEIGEKPVKLVNEGESPLDVVVEPLAGDHPTVFGLNVPGPDRSLLHLEAGTSADLLFTFRPAFVGDANAQLTVRACATCDPLVIGLHGKGIAAGLVPDPDPLDFGAVLPNHVAVRTLKFHNVGSRRIAITDIKPAQAGTEFSVVRPDVWPALAPGETGEVRVQYAPVSTGGDQTQLVVATDDARTPYFNVNVKGYGGGPAVEVVPAVLDFGVVGVAYPVTRRVVIYNKGVNDAGSTLDDLVIDAVEIPAGSDYTWAAMGGATLPLRIAPGARGMLEVTFAPMTLPAGRRSSELHLHTNDGEHENVVVPLTGDARAVAPCEYDLQPAANPGLLFGVVQRGRSSRLSMSLRNLSDRDCVVGKVDLTAATPAAFSLPGGAIYGQVVGPYGRLYVEVDFSPPGNAASGTEYAGEVEVNVASTRAPVQMMGLSGRAAEVCLSITPMGIEFGVVEPNCMTNTRTFTIYNACRTPVVIQDVKPGLGQGDFQVLRPQVPNTLDPQEEMTFDVRFRPLAVGPSQGTVEVYSDQTINGGRPFVLTLSGTGQYDASMVETFVQASTPRADILLVVDNSGSMSEEQEALAANFEAFMRFAVGQQIDYHIGVTDISTSDGCGSGSMNGRFVCPVGSVTPQCTLVDDPQVVACAANGSGFITPTTADPRMTFCKRVLLGSSGCATEQPLEAAYLALSDPAINGVNAGFLRPDAFLSVILVTDEEDQSPQPIDFYVNFFQNVKGPRGSNLVSISGIVGTTDPECDSATGNAEYCQRVVEVARRTGGITESICTENWNLALQKLGLTAFGYKSRFILSSDPDPATIQVFVDGQEVAPGTLWAYTPETNSIDFMPTAIPPAESTIRVSYVVACR